jgi:TRAP-type C4-dicarboxylate transport system permease small subunit
VFKEKKMDAQRLIAILLIIAGALGLAYGGFTYTEDRHTAEVGSLQMSIDEKEHVNIPVWAGVGAIVVGGLLLVVGRRSR